MARKLLGRKVKVTSDNECYDSFRDKTLTITRVIRGRTSGISNDGYQALCDFEDENGNPIPNSLYEWEFDTI